MPCLFAALALSITLRLQAAQLFAPPSQGNRLGQHGLLRRRQLSRGNRCVCGASKKPGQSVAVQGSDRLRAA